MTFDLFSIGDLIFFYNSGSICLMAVIFVVSYVGVSGVQYIAKKMYRIGACRKMGVHTKRF